MNEITIVEIAGELVVDSRIIAEQLGIEHRSFTKLINKHLSKIEAKFGQVGFEIATVQNSAGAINEVKFTWLNEGQITALLTLCRNTDRVVDLKFDLVEKFQKQKKQLENPIDRALFTQLANRIAKLESEAVPALPPAMPEITTRKRINKLVNDYAFFTGFQHERVWRKIYTALNDHFGYDIFHKKEKGNKLDRIELDGQLGNLLTVAQQYLEIPANILAN